MIYDEYHGNCADYELNDVKKDVMDLGNSSIEACAGLCSQDNTCSGIEYYEGEVHEGHRCFKFPGSIGTSNLPIVRGGANRDATCYIKRSNIYFDLTDMSLKIRLALMKLEPPMKIFQKLVSFKQLRNLYFLSVFFPF